MTKWVVIGIIWMSLPVRSQQTVNRELNFEKVNDTAFVNLKQYCDEFAYDMRYATANNFLNAEVYECAECYLRFKTAKALVNANKKLLKKGYRIKLFDCYRPLDIQKKMWAIVSNPEYVADPKKGSIHNRGGAVDLTIIDLNGTPIDMGTDFDHFGPEAAHDYANLSTQIKANRKKLRNAMTSAGFSILKSEWWHYNLKKSAQQFKVSNFKWQCP